MTETNPAPDLAKGEALATWALRSGTEKQVLGAAVFMCPAPGQAFTATHLTQLLGIQNPDQRLASLVRDGLMARAGVEVGDVWFAPTALGRACMGAATEWGHGGDDLTPLDRVRLLPAGPRAVFEYMATSGGKTVDLANLAFLAECRPGEDRHSIAGHVAVLVSLDLVNGSDWPNVHLSIAGNRLAERYRDTLPDTPSDLPRLDAVAAIVSLAGHFQEMADEVGILAEELEMADSNPVEALQRLLDKAKHPEPSHTNAVTAMARWIQATTPAD